MKSSDSTTDAVTDAMVALGGTPDAVAGSLRKMGVRGYPGCCFSCPLALYLKARGCGFVAVGKTDVACGSPDKESSRHRLPAAVREFVSRFDDGLYPDLREEEVEDEGE